VIGIDATDAILASAKTGMGIDEILRRSSSGFRRPRAIRPHRCRR
jgi:translation elongation factor EF-4